MIKKKESLEGKVLSAVEFIKLGFRDTEQYFSNLKIFADGNLRYCVEKQSGDKFKIHYQYPFNDGTAHNPNDDYRR